MDIKAFVAKLTNQAKQLPAKSTKRAMIQNAVIEARPAIALLLEKRYKPSEIAKIMTETAGEGGEKFTSQALAQALPDLFPKKPRQKAAKANEKTLGGTGDVAG